MASRVHSDSREIVLCSAVAAVLQLAAGSPGDREEGREGREERGGGGNQGWVNSTDLYMYCHNGYNNYDTGIYYNYYIPYKYIEFSGCVGMLY